MQSQLAAQSVLNSQNINEIKLRKHLKQLSAPLDAIEILQLKSILILLLQGVTLECVHILASRGT